jgi:hypothetical protein
MRVVGVGTSTAYVCPERRGEERRGEERGEKRKA